MGNTYDNDVVPVEPDPEPEVRDTIGGLKEGPEGDDPRDRHLEDATIEVAG